MLDTTQHIGQYYSALYLDTVQGQRQLFQTGTAALTKAVYRGT